ncbi:MAG: tRNA-dihydrouridine synthase [Gammaproteobacteria bacterium]|nr:tRNA-dihydrouridine synthase [Gammaproteobacteria bacterium]
MDNYMRDTLTGIGGYDACVTEFVRVVDKVMPKKVFYRLCPELLTSATTESATPVIIQLLGSDPIVLAENAAYAAELGAPGIDLNFGCPSKIVNRKSGGAALLKEPDRIHQIISAVRAAVPYSIPVSAKIRLGFDHTDAALDIAHAVEDAGASYVVVHARTKVDGYKAPARWEWLGHINRALTIPVVANGDINNIEDYRRCLEISGCKNIMIGRGAVSRPDLARQIRNEQQGQPCEAMSWPDVSQLLMNMAQKMSTTVADKIIFGRIKQWLAMLKREYPEAQNCFDEVRNLSCFSEAKLILESSKEKYYA